MQTARAVRRNPGAYEASQNFPQLHIERDAETPVRMFQCLSEVPSGIERLHKTDNLTYCLALCWTLLALLCCAVLCHAALRCTVLLYAGILLHHTP